jgi:tRNA(adenine34) deaminase
VTTPKGSDPDPAGYAHAAFMRAALAEAEKARALGEVPVGAVVVVEGAVVAAGFNQPIRETDPSAHAEIVALRAAARSLGTYRLPGATVYVTLEPCLMCVGALVNARVAAVVYGAPEPKWGALRSLLDVRSLAVNHRFEIVSGVLEDECRAPVVTFFRSRRERG